MTRNVNDLEPNPWHRSFYAGDRLHADQLYGAAFVGKFSDEDVGVGAALLRSSYGYLIQQIYL